MAEQTLRVPENPVELREFVSPQGYGVEELIEILNLELNGLRRQYIALRLVSRINKLRADALLNDTMKRLTND